MSAHVNIDRQLCIGSGTCVRLAPRAFELDDDELARVLDPKAVDFVKLRLAVEACPTGAISLIEAEREGESLRHGHRMATPPATRGTSAPLSQQPDRTRAETSG